MPTLTALPSFATPPVATATAELTAPVDIGPFDSAVLTLRVAGIGEVDCVVSPPTSATWESAWGSGPIDDPTVDGSSLVYTFDVGVLGNGITADVTASVSGGCAGPLTQDTATATSVWYQYYAYGYSYRGVAPGLGWDDIVSVPGVFVELLEVSGGPDGVPVSTATTTGDPAGFTLYAPFTQTSDILREYKIRYTYPDGGPVFYWALGNPWNTTSPDNWDDGEVGGPATWVNRDYSVSIAAPWSFTGDPSISGVAWVDGAAAEDVVVDLVTESDVFATDTTDDDGDYTLAPEIGTQDAASANYSVRFTYPDDTVVWYSSESASDWPSPSDQADATLVSPETWDGSGSYDAFVSTGENSGSETDYDLVCNEYGDEQTDVELGDVVWYDVCLTDATIADATIGDRSDAFDTFGELEFQVDGDTYTPASADWWTYDQETPQYTFADNDEWVDNSEGVLTNVDIVVDREFVGSWVRWTVNVYEAGTDTIADVPFTFGGNLGSDDGTQWAGTGDVRVSHDEGYDPILIHQGASSLEVDEDDAYTSATGELTYSVALVDYTGDCVVDSTVAAAMTIAQTADFGDSIATLVGGECPPPPVWAFEAPELFVGVPFDETFEAPSEGGWDWEWGGSLDLWDLPDGLDWEMIDEWEHDTAPSMRIFGTPTTAGPYTFGLYITDNWNSNESAISGIVQIEKVLDMSLELEVGDVVEGGEVGIEASGLLPEATYLLEVHSDPTTLASGQIDENGELATTGTLPELEAGWHTLTFSSSWYDETVASAKLWLLVDEDGTLVETSNAAPEIDLTPDAEPTPEVAKLPNTGVDSTGTLLLGGLALLLGLGLVVIRRRTA